MVAAAAAAPGNGLPAVLLNWEPAPSEYGCVPSNMPPPLAKASLDGSCPYPILSAIRMSNSAAAVVLLLSKALKANGSAAPSWLEGPPLAKGIVPGPPGRSGSDPAMRNEGSKEVRAVVGIENDVLRERRSAPPAFPGVAGLTPMGFGWPYPLACKNGRSPAVPKFGRL